MVGTGDGEQGGRRAFGARRLATTTRLLAAAGFVFGLMASPGCAHQSRDYDGVSVSRGPVKGTVTQKTLLADSARSIAVIETDIGRGMGFVIDERGYVITNRHVVEDAQHIAKMVFPAQDPPATYESVQIVYIDPRRDLALLHVNSPDPLPPLPLAAHKSLPIRRYVHEKDPVILFKHRLDLDGTEGEGSEDGAHDEVLVPLELAQGSGEIIPHNGAVTSLAVYNPAAGPGAFVGVTMAVKRGQSGGPVLDRHGRAVGVVTWTWRDRVGGYAIPIGEAMRMLDERPQLLDDRDHQHRCEKRTREFLAALGRGDIDDARRLTSPSHARHVREQSMSSIMQALEGEGMPVLHGFFAAVESLIDEDDATRLKELREIVARTGTPTFREALGVEQTVEPNQIMSFFLELGQAYLAARTAGGQSPEEAFHSAVMRLQTIDAARTFAMAEFLEELAGAEIEIREVEVLPGAYTPRAVVSLESRRATKKLMQRYAVQFESQGPPEVDAIKLTLHMKLEWGDWYIADVSPTPLAEG